MNLLFKSVKLSSLIIILSFFIVGFSTFSDAQASTESHQFQLTVGPGIFVGSKEIDPSFDFNVEPEYFFTKNMSASFRFDVTAGGIDSIHLGGRFRYYFDLPNHSRWNLYIGAGAGGIINFDGGGYGDFAIPVFGYQYDLTKHIKFGSEISFDIVFNKQEAAFATRLMPIQFKWAF